MWFQTDKTELNPEQPEPALLTIALSEVIRTDPGILHISTLAQAAHEALGVVGAAQRGDDLARDEVPAAVAAGAVELLVVLGADVLLVLEEEA